MTFEKFTEAVEEDAKQALENGMAPEQVAAWLIAHAMSLVIVDLDAEKVQLTGQMEREGTFQLSFRPEERVVIH